MKSYIPVLSAGVTIFAGLVMFVCLFVSSNLQFYTPFFTLGLGSPAVSTTLGAGVTGVQTWDTWLVDGCQVPNSRPHNWAPSAVNCCAISGTPIFHSFVTTVAVLDLTCYYPCKNSYISRFT